jgi:hypothetical protein
MSVTLLEVEIAPFQFDKILGGCGVDRDEPPGIRLTVPNGLVGQIECCLLDGLLSCIGTSEPFLL